MRQSISKNLVKSAAVAVLSMLPLFACAETAFSQSPSAETSAVRKTREILVEIIEQSFPELDAKKIRVRPFRSRTTFFKTQFSVSRFLTLRAMHTTVLVNPSVFEKNVPQNGIRAILAHELGHALYYAGKNRFKLFGLIGLADNGFTAKFERRTDLTAIERGYGDGLIAYREWLYRNVPAKNLAAKKRDYFTPDELRVIIRAIERKPEIIKMLVKKVPRNLSETIKAVS